VPFDIIRGECDVLVAIDPDTDQEADGDRDISVFQAMLSSYANTRKSLSGRSKKHAR
jgi:hypothetical protein